MIPRLKKCLKSLSPEHTYEEFDFPVRIKPVESFKIRIKVKMVNTNLI